jgi:hypothetical protein
MYRGGEHHRSAPVLSDEIFLINNNRTLSPLRRQPYPQETDLQELLAKFPEVISGSQIDPEEPRRWLH